MSHDDTTPMRVRWARLRFSIIGPLLASPPQPGELQAQLLELAAKTYRHPTTKEAIRFGASTIERWFYEAKEHSSPIEALERRVHSHAGTHPAISAKLAEAIGKLYQDHPRWTFKLHYDNLATLVKEDPTLGPLPSYPTVRRYMRDRGFLRQKKRRHRRGSDEPAREIELREKRSFEVSHVHALWHLDFHAGSRKLLLPSGDWKTPMLLGILDDHSRLCCHLQWYLDETADSLIHGLCQAIQKRGLCRALMTDNGAAMTAAETTEGLERLSITHKTTLPNTPEQNAKQENFWAQVEGRLIAMLEGVTDLTLPLLNEATQAWVEREYHRSIHSEIGEPPLERALRGPTVGRPSPSSEHLRRVFRTETTRMQRRSDGTITVEGIRFEVPSRYRTLVRLTVRVARWDKSQIDLVDPRTGAHLCMLYPLDKEKNADGRRRVITPGALGGAAPGPSGVAPRLRVLMQEYAATGLPPAYLPKDEIIDATDPTETTDPDKEST
jgi:putative transposase